MKKNVARFGLVLNLHLKFENLEKKCKIKKEVWIGPLDPPYPRLPLDLMNLPICRTW